jgi:hypothetical protein
MASRIDIELTSHDADRGEWTWRAAGARNPKGTVPASLVWEGAKVGDVARAEVVRTLDGIGIVSLAPPPQPTAPTNRIELVGTRRDGPTTAAVATARTERRRPRATEQPHEHARRTGDRAGAGPGDRRDATPTQGDRREHRREPRRRPQPSASAHAASSAPRLRPRDTHRRALLESTIPEHRPIAEALLRGGMPEVRAAIARDREAAAAEGRAPAPEEATLKIAEDLLPKVRVATWLDRAEAALPIAETLALRDLRSVVASVDPSSKDPRVLDYAATLRAVLDRRVAAEIDRWLDELRAALAAGRTVRALRLASRLPDPSARLPEDLQRDLVAAADRELVPDTPAERWMVLIDAISASPVRRAVTVTALPADAPPELNELAREHAGRIPSLGARLGVSMPAPPKPEILARVPKTSRKPRGARASTAGHIPEDAPRSEQGPGNAHPEAASPEAGALDVPDRAAADPEAVALAGTEASAPLTETPAEGTTPETT